MDILAVILAITLAVFLGVSVAIIYWLIAINDQHKTDWAAAVKARDDWEQLSISRKVRIVEQASEFAKLNKSYLDALDAKDLLSKRANEQAIVINGYSQRNGELFDQIMKGEIDAAALDKRIKFIKDHNDKLVGVNTELVGKIATLEVANESLVTEVSIHQSLLIDLRRRLNEIVGLAHFELNSPDGPFWGLKQAPRCSCNPKP